MTAEINVLSIQHWQYLLQCAVYTIHRCLHNKASKYLTDCCVVVSDIAVVSDCAQHTVASWTYCAIDELHSAVGCSLSLDQPYRIRFQTSSEMRLRTLGSH